MEVTLFGVRGTSPVTEPGFQEFGGETTSVLVEGAEDEKILIDAGTGIRAAGARLGQEAGGKALLLVTHFHLDHLAGFPSFSLLMRPDWGIEIASAAHNGHGAEEVFTRLLGQPFWPIQMETAPAAVAFRDLRPASGGEALRWGGLRVSWTRVHHPGGSTAYRVDEPGSGGSFIFATDNEAAAASEIEQEEFLSLAREGSPAGLLIVDGQYNLAEYERKRGWGHNAWETAAKLARAAGVGGLLVTHHDPAALDEVLLEREEKLQAVFPGGGFARQGMEIEISGGGRTS